MIKPPLPTDEASRLASLHNLHILDTPQEERFDRITRLVKQFFDVPIVLISLVDANRQWFKSCYGLAATETERDVSFCAHAILGDEILLIEDALLDFRFADNPNVTGEPFVRFYAGHPLSALDGSKLGTLCIIDRRPRKLDITQLQALRDFAAWVEKELSNFQQDQIIAMVRSSEMRLRTVFNGVIDAIFTINERGFIESLNPSAERIFGYSATELTGQNVKILIPKDQYKVYQDFVQNQVLGGKDKGVRIESETTGQRKDGSTFPMEFSITDMRLNGQRIFTAICRDITHRKQAEEALRESEARYRSVIEVLEEGIVLQEANGVITACNSSAERILGLSAEQMMGLSSLDPRWAAIHEDGAPFPGETHPAIITLQTGQACSGVIMGVYKPDATFTWISINSQPLFHENDTNPYAVVSSFSDITKRLWAEQILKESEERFRQFAENFRDVLWMTDPKQSKPLYISPSYEQVWGRSCQSFYDDPLSFLEAIHPDDRERVATKQTTKVEGDYSEEYRVVHPDGSIRWVWSRAFPIRNEKGEVYRIAGISEDITDRKKLDSLKNEFISTVSHELRTPLTSIRGSLGLIMGGVAGAIPSQAQTMLDIAYKNSERLIFLINDILDIEKIESGKLVFNFQPVELLPVIEQALEANRAYAEQFGVSFQLGAALPKVKVNVDTDRLMQVLANLLSNASKFSPQGQKVEVEVVRYEEGVRVSVSDHGAGIPEEFHSHIFQKFAQADSSATRQRGGTGLGLSITKAIIERMGGQINFDSTPNVGTTFYFDLPEWVEPAKIVPPDENKSQPLLVLVCEDDPDIATLMRLMLVRNGFEVDVTHSAEEARQFLNQKQYAGITIDLRLPGQGGIALIQELQTVERTSHLPIVVVSVSAEEGRRELNGLAVNVVDWIEKPINQPHLVAALKKATRGRLTSETN